MFITPSFKKSLIVEQFQGNYLKCSHSLQQWAVIQDINKVVTLFITLPSIAMKITAIERMPDKHSHSYEGLLFIKRFCRVKYK